MIQKDLNHISVDQNMFDIHFHVHPSAAWVGRSFDRMLEDESSHLWPADLRHGKTWLGGHGSMAQGVGERRISDSFSL
jgi:hypothetical protein